MVGTTAGYVSKLRVLHEWWVQRQAMYEKNADCLCGHDSLHGQINTSQDQDSEKSDRSVAKKRRKVFPRIRMQKSIPAQLNSLIKFYDECSNTSVPSSENPESDVPSGIQLQSSDVETILLRDSDESFENSDKNSEDESESNPSSENSAVGIYSSSLYSGLEETIDMNIGDRFDKQPINQVSDVAPTNLVASLIALVSKHNASDSLLNDLLKRDQAIFGEGAVSPWFVQKQLNDLYSKFVSRKLSVDSGEIILIKFCPQLNEIVLNSLSEMLSYSRNKNIAEDIFMPDLQIVDGKILVRLIVNTDGALVAKSPPSSAWPLFIAVADLPPRKRQAFQNIVLACLFVGHGYPDFDIFFIHIEQELSEPEHILFQGERLCLIFKAILFIADLVGKSKVLKMKRCNGFYGCTLCTQKGVHYGGVHRYPHDEKFVMRSYESHMINLNELEKGSDDEIVPKSHLKAELELRTKGVQGRSKILTLIPNQPLSSPVDPMHQLFLGVTKDLLGHLYDKMLTNRKKDLNQFLSSMKLPCELKNSVRPLDSLSTFKAKELKVFLFYLAPVIFPPFLFGEDRVSDEKDLKQLVFATRLLYDNNQHTKECDILLNKFCRSMRDKTEKMDTINFHLLRHLSWQVENVGPLFTTSAAMFESANRLLIAPLTGTVNHCQLMVCRFLRAKLVSKMEVEDDSLSSMIKGIREPTKFDESFSFTEGQETQNFKSKFPEAQLFCRIYYTHFLGSVSYGRGSNADNFVAAVFDDDIFVGEILFFYRDPTTGCLVRKFEIVKKIKLVETDIKLEVPFGFIVGKEIENIEIPLNAIRCKLFRFVFQDSVYLISMLKHYEHN